MTGKNLKRLRLEMEKEGVDIYVMTLADYHMSEYVGDYFKEIEYISGFTGTNATLIVTGDEAGLWTDGRYFIQAREQMAGSGVKLYEMGTEGVPTSEEFIESHLSEGKVLAFDGRLFSYSWYEKIEKKADEKDADIRTDINLLDAFFKERKPLPAEPVFMSYLYITQDSCLLYAQAQSFDVRTLEYLNENGVRLLGYDSIYSDLRKINEKSILIDPDVVNSELVNELPSSVTLIRQQNPTLLMKAVKNATEIKNTEEMHIDDGLAVTRFIYWLKHSIGKEEITEMSASDKLLEFRQAADDFIEVSFDTISAYKENAALMHYEPGHDHEVELKPEGMLLVDSGGHYYRGTTDITRTIVLGPVSEKEKKAYTQTLRSHLRLMKAKFPKGACGANLDILARGPMWDLGLDYRCGTGHGVGHILNVHEGPNTFRWNVKNDEARTELQPGMITTDEPGLYYEGEFGIRIESELLCVEDEKTEYGQFYSFKDLTYCPIDLDAVIPDMLTQYERQALNAYHADVYETLAPRLPKEEAAWLKEATRAI